MDPRWKTKSSKLLAGFALFTASCIIFPCNVFAATRVTVTGDMVNVRGGPDTVSAVVSKIHKNEQYNALDKRGDWYQINVNGIKGWVAGWLVRAENIPDPVINQVAVKTNALNVRSGPGTSYQIVAQANAGDKFDIISNSNNWYKIKLPGGNAGWVAGWLVDISKKAVEQPAQQPEQKVAPAKTSNKQATITSTGVNVRSGPGTGYGVVAKASKGDKFSVTDISGQWLKINLAGGKTGWVASWLASVNETVAKTPTTATPPQKPSESLLAVVNVNEVNVRGGPGTTHGVVSQVSRGQKLGVIDRTGDWYKVKLDGGVVGWVAGWLINVESAEASPAAGDPQVETSDTDQSSNQDSAQSEPSKLEKIEAREENGHSLITIKSTGPLNYDMFLIKNPNRLVLDIKNIDPGDLPDKISIGTEAVSQLRSGWFSKTPPVVRVVFDLNGPIVSLDKLSEDRKQLDLDIFVPQIGSYLQGRVIAIDPGHGGKDPGAKGPTGLQEKDINLDIALKLAKILTDSGARVVLTRSDDSYVDLYERTAIAERNDAEVFLSIHNNANSDPSKNGTSTYLRRDTGDVAPGIDQADNRKLAGAIQSELLRSLERRSLGVLQANFVVLRTSPVPSALAEIAFISNYEEENMLRQEAIRQKIAESLASGLNNYFAPNN